MKTLNRLFVSVCSTACAMSLTFTLLGIIPATVKAQEDYPSGPIEMIVASSPGSGGDIVGRLIAQHMAEDWKHEVVVVNKQGASGIIGSEYVARSKPDGYTIFLTSGGPITINPAIYKTLPYDAIEDFAPVSMVARVNFVLTVHPSFPATTLDGFLTALHSNPGKYSFASIGAGSPHHLWTEMFIHMTKVDIVHVPYKGTVPGLTGLLGDHVDLFFVGIPPSLPHIRAGKLRALGVATQERLSSLPDVPTIIEAGVPGYEVFSFFGVIVPAKTPEPIVNKLNAKIIEIINRPAVNEALLARGFEPGTSTPAEFAERIKTLIATWKRVVPEAGIEQR